MKWGIVSTLGLVWLFSISASADDKTARQVCTEGVFAVDGAPLLPAASTIANDAVILHDGQVSIASGCPPVEAKLRVTPLGTIVRASWRRCGDVAEGVRLFAFIKPSCLRMNGFISAVKPSIHRRFLAAQCNDPATCRDFCRDNDDCSGGEYCARRPGHCDGRGMCKARPTVCPDVVEPVCGCDGNTYENRCEAAAAGVGVAQRGRCPVRCDPADPNGCADGQFCHLPPGVCSSTDVKGVCVDKPDACPEIVEPVCGCDGKTYSNRCEAGAAGVNIKHQGRCPVPCDPENPECREHQFCEKPAGSCESTDVRGLCTDIPSACPDHYEPVCGCDGMTYSNDCDRRAAGVSKAHDGPCAECRDACDCYPRPFPEPCAALCPSCGNFWTCREGQCVAFCGPQPSNACENLCSSNEQCDAGDFCHKFPGQCDDAGVCQDRPDACTREFQPLCGCDGHTYGNRCQAFAAGTSIAHTGPCHQKCGTIAGIPCRDEDDFCELPPGQCNTSDLEGMCVDVPEVCPLFIEPVCGCDGKTYANNCERMRAQVQLAHRGRCENTASIVPR